MELLGIEGFMRGVDESASLLHCHDTGEAYSNG